MATAGDGGATPASTYAGAGGEGGAGGKFRKRPFRRTGQSTPYDRPPTTLRNPSNSGGWLSRMVVDPASKLLSSSAHYLLSSVLRKRLPPSSSSLRPPEASHEQTNVTEVPMLNKHDQEVAVAVESGNHNDISNDTGIYELEQLLRKKMFTKSEIDHLTQLLHSRTADFPVEDEYKTTTDVSKQNNEFERHRLGLSHGSKENSIENKRFSVTVSTPLSSRDVEEDVASPSELAKAYMGSRPSKVSPSLLGRSQVSRQNPPMLNNESFNPKSAIITPTIKTASHVGFPSSSFTTPRSRGRSAIYSMARTPYSKVRPVTSQKNNVGPRSLLLSRSLLEDGEQFTSKQNLKRRSSFMEDDIGYVGSLRRVRQKSNLTSRVNPLSVRGGDVNFDSRLHLASARMPVFRNEPLDVVSKTAGENEGNDIPTTIHAYVPSKSSEMAAKILQHLEKLTPKEKSIESKHLSSSEKPASKLESNILSGRALKSLEDVNSSKLLENGHRALVLKNSGSALLQDVRDSTLEKLEKVKENGVGKISVSPNMLGPVEKGDASVFAEQVSNTDCVAQPLKKKWAFQISAPEDSLVMDDASPASTSAVEKQEKTGTYVVAKNSVSSKVIDLDKPSLFTEGKAPTDVLDKIASSLGASKGPLTVDKINGSMFSSISPDRALQSGVFGQSTPEIGNSVSAEETKFPRPFCFSSKSVFSNAAAENESSAANSSALSNTGPEKSNSFSSLQLKSPWPEKVYSENAVKVGDKTVGFPTLAASVSTLSSSTISYGGVANNLTSSSNGSFGSAPIVLANPFLASTNQTFSGITPSAPSTTPPENIATFSTMTSSSVTNASSLSTSLTKSPVFKFGSTVPPCSVFVPTSSVTEPTEINRKSEKEGTSDSLGRSGFGGTYFMMSSSGSTSSLGLLSPATSSSSSQLLSSLFSTGNEGLVSKHTSSVSVSSTVSQSMPVQFGSSASSPILGTTFTTSSSQFVSSTPNVFGAGAGFGIGSSGGVTSSTFTCDANSSAVPSVSNCISTNTASTTGFNFSASSSSASSSLNFINSSVTSAPIFPFGSSSSAMSSGSSSVNPSTAASPGIFSVTNSISSTSGSTASVFGSSWQPSVFGSKFSSSSPSTGFSLASSSTATSLSQSQSTFGNPAPIFSASSNNGDQMNMEDSMAEDPVQATPSAFPPVFGQPSSQPGFVFGSSISSPAPAFQFGGQQNQVAPQNFSAFQASNSLEFNAGGGFSLGSGGGGGDKSNRKFLKVSKNKNRRK